MANTELPWKVQRSNGSRKVLHIVSEKPGAPLPIRIATMHKLKGFFGDAESNAALLVKAVNGWHDPAALRARLAEMQS